MTREEAVWIIRGELERYTRESVVHGKEEKALAMAIEALKERPHGEWIPHTFKDKRTGETVNFTIGSIVRMTCSVCNKDAFAGGNFCPNCGASMRKEGDEK